MFNTPAYSHFNAKAKTLPDKIPRTGEAGGVRSCLLSEIKISAFRHSAALSRTQTHLSSRCMVSASVLLSSSMTRLGGCTGRGSVLYWSTVEDGAPWWGGSRPPWCVPGGCAEEHFWGKAGSRGSKPPGGAQITTFLGGRGGENLPTM